MKLVRDNIPVLHKESGHTVVGRRLAGKELEVALCQKLQEESGEVDVSLTREELIEEIGDVQQVIDDLLTVIGVSKDTLTDTMQKKSGRKGGFLRGEYIETVTIPNEKDELVVRFRKNPEKYPELTNGGDRDRVLPVMEKGEYLHTKSGKLYEVIGVSLETETNQPLVLYRPLYDSQYEFFARPYEMFMQRVVVGGKEVKRFEKVTDK